MSHPPFEEGNATYGQRILLVEDDGKLAALVAEFLSANGFEVTIEPRGDRAVERILTDQPSPDLVVLDIMLPGLDGLSVCKRVRPSYAGSILMLTARGDDVDEVVGLELGADDYMAKPVRPRVLLARINNLLRRSGPGLANHEGPDETSAGRGAGPTTERLVLGTIVIDVNNRTVQVKDQLLDLTTAEFDLLLLLAQHAGEILSRDFIYSELRGIPYDGLDRSIDLRITRLRRKLGDLGKQPQIIKSIRGEGYLLVMNP